MGQDGVLCRDGYGSGASRRIHCTLDACEGVLSLLSSLAITILASASFKRPTPLTHGP